MKHPHFLSCLLIVFVGLLSYSNSFRGAFVFDDVQTVVFNDAIRSFDVSSLWHQSHPRFLTNYSYAINYRLHNLDVFGYHGTNVLLHIGNAILVYWIVTLLWRGRGFHPLIVALLFVAHPIQTQAVNSIAQRSTVLAAFFYLSALFLFIQYLRKRKNAKITFLFFILSLASALFSHFTKEFTYSLPAVLLLVPWVFTGKKHGMHTYLFPLVLFFLISFGSYIVTHSDFFSGRRTNLDTLKQAVSYTPDTRITRTSYALTQLPIVFKYLSILVFPIAQNLDYDYPIYHSFLHPSVLAAFFLHCLILGAALWMRKKQKVGSFGIFFFYLTIVLESSIFPITDVIMEHRVYLPSVGFFIAFVWGIVYLLQKFQISNKNTYHPIGNLKLEIGIYLKFLFIVLLLMFLTYQRNKVWYDGLSLWSDVVSKSPNKARAHFNLGGALIKYGQYDEGVAQLRRASELDPAMTKAIDAVLLQIAR